MGLSHTHPRSLNYSQNNGWVFEGGKERKNGAKLSSIELVNWKTVYKFVVSYQSYESSSST